MVVGLRTLLIHASMAVFSAYVATLGEWDWMSNIAVGFSVILALCAILDAIIISCPIPEQEEEV